MKKLLGLLLVIGLAFSVSACSSTETATGKLAKIQEAGKIVIGTNSGYPPYEFYDTRDNKKDLVGVDIDLGNKIGEELGVDVVWVDMEFDALIPQLMAGKIDIILAGMVNTPERAETVAFTQPYIDTYTVVVAHKDKIDSVNSVEKLNGKSVAVQVGTTQEESANAIEGLKVVSVPGVTDSITQVTSGKTDSLFIQKIVAQNIVKQYPDYTYADIQGLSREELFDGASLVMNKGEDALLSKLDGLIGGWIKDGTMDKLFQANIDLYEKVYVNTK